jgi:hypothetical protein
MYSEMHSDTTAMHSTTICGHCGVATAHGGRLLRGAMCFVELKIAKVEATSESTTRLQAQLMLRRKILARRTFSLTAYPQKNN